MTVQEDIQSAAFTVDEFIKWSRIGRTKVYQLINDGNLKSRKVGRKTLILRSDAEAWLNALPEAA